MISPFSRLNIVLWETNQVSMRTILSLSEEMSRKKFPGELSWSELTLAAIFSIISTNYCRLISIHTRKGESFQMKPEEQKVLGILATIFGSIALLGSWIPFINYLSFFIAIVALILGIIGLIVNLKKRKTMAIIGTSLAVASVVLFFTAQILYANIYKDFAREFNRSYREASASIDREEEGDLTDDSSDFIPEEEEEDSFTWTQEQFDALIKGDLDNKGKGGTNYKDIIKKHGLPDSEFDSIIEGYDTKKITYIGIDDKIKTVTLTFVKQDDGQLLLVHKIAVGLGESQQQRDSGIRV